MLSLYINSISLWAKVKPSMHYLAQMRLFDLGPLCVQLVLKVTSSHTDSNAYTLLQPSPEIQNLFTDSPRSGSQLPGGQRVSWSQIFRWVVRGALTCNTGGYFTENQTLPNLTHCNGWQVGASWTEHAGGPWMASQWPPGLSRGPTPAPAAVGAKVNALVCVTVIYQVIHRVLQIWFGVVQVRVLFYSCSRLEYEKHLWLLSSLLF